MRPKYQKSKNRYQQMLKVYRDRREQLRQQFGLRNGQRAPEAYHQRVARINSRIRTIEKQLWRIEGREKKLHWVRSQIKEFMGVDVRQDIHTMYPDFVLAKHLFYKYCLENGVRGVHVMTYLKGNTRTAARARRNFTRSFQTHPHHKKMWDRFNAYMRQQKESNVVSLQKRQAI